jgi:hypothetical protein
MNLPNSEKKVFTFAEIEKVVKLADPLKILKALLDQLLSKDIANMRKNFMGLTPKIQYLLLAAKVLSNQVPL